MYAVWEEIAYAVNYSANGPVLNTYTTQRVGYTSSILLPDALTWEDGDFIGWSLSPTTDPYGNKDIYQPGSTIPMSLARETAEENDEGVMCIVVHAVWQLRDSAVVDDTVVTDFTAPIKFSPYEMGDSSVVLYHAGDLCGNSWSVSLPNGGKGDYGTFKVNDDGYTVSYTPTKVMNDVDEVELLLTLNYPSKSETFTSKITVAPASNIYYEETVMSELAYSNRTDWTSVKGTHEEKGTQTDKGNVEGVYGFNNKYDVINAEYSDDTALYVKTTSTNKLSQAKKFEFTGTGFDLVSSCGPTTGVLLVNVKQGTSIKKVLIVDTYCADSFAQTPVATWSGDYSTYNVEVTATYLTTAGALNTASTTKGVKSNLIDTGLVMNSAQPSGSFDAKEILAEAGIKDVSADKIELVWFDDNSILNGGTGATASRKAARNTEEPTPATSLDNYIDGIRVYNPLGNDSSLYSGNEKNPVYANVVNSLVSPDAQVGNGLAYVSGDATDLTWSTYQSAGPLGEIYLYGGKNNGITIPVTAYPGERVMVALRAVNGPTKLTVSSNISQNTVANVDIVSATEMYYDITPCLGEITVPTEVVITIVNSGDNMLAVNHIKFSGVENTGNVINPRSMARSTGAGVDLTQNKFLPVTEEIIAEAQNSLAKEAVSGMVVNGVVMPIIEDEGDEPNIPEGNEPDAPEENEPNTPDDGGNNGAGSDDSSSGDSFDIFSLIRLLIEIIKKILFNTVGNGTLV